MPLQIWLSPRMGKVLISMKSLHFKKSFVLVLTIGLSWPVVTHGEIIHLQSGEKVIGGEKPSRSSPASVKVNDSTSRRESKPLLDSSSLTAFHQAPQEGLPPIVVVPLNQEIQEIPEPGNQSPLPGDSPKEPPHGLRSISDDQMAEAVFDGAATFIQQGDIEKGLDLLKQITEIQPKRPDWHMNYGLLLFTKANRLYKNGEIQEAQKIFTQAEKELLLSTELFDKTDERLKPFISQCYFLLGEMDLRVFQDRAHAKSFYQKSLEYSSHKAAQEALKDLR